MAPKALFMLGWLIAGKVVAYRRTLSNMSDSHAAIELSSGGAVSRSLSPSSRVLQTESSSAPARTPLPKENVTLALQMEPIAWSQQLIFATANVLGDVHFENFAKDVPNLFPSDGLWVEDFKAMFNERCAKDVGNLLSQLVADATVKSDANGTSYDEAVYKKSVERTVTQFLAEHIEEYKWEAVRFPIFARDAWPLLSKADILCLQEVPSFENLDRLMPAPESAISRFETLEQQDLYPVLKKAGYHALLKFEQEMSLGGAALPREWTDAVTENFTSRVIFTYRATYYPSPGWGKVAYRNQKQGDLRDDWNAVYYNAEKLQLLEKYHFRAGEGVSDKAILERKKPHLVLLFRHVQTGLLFILVNLHYHAGKNGGKASRAEVFMSVRLAVASLKERFESTIKWLSTQDYDTPGSFLYENKRWSLELFKVDVNQIPVFFAGDFNSPLNPKSGAVRVLPRAVPFQQLIEGKEPVGSLQGAPEELLESMHYSSPEKTQRLSKYPINPSMVRYEARPLGDEAVIKDMGTFGAEAYGLAGEVIDGLLYPTGMEQRQTTSTISASIAPAESGIANIRTPTPITAAHLMKWIVDGRVDLTPGLWSDHYPVYVSLGLHGKKLFT